MSCCKAGGSIAFHFLISLAITLTALGLYVFTYIGEHPSPLLVFMERLELDALDTRFRMRPPKYTPPDPRIVIVDIDQKSQEGLGKWPFSRSNFANMLDVLREDGAKVVGFDVTFDKPDQTAAPVRAMAERLAQRKKGGQRVDPKLEEEIKALAAEYDADKQFGEAIQKFGNVVLGNFFFPKEELKGTDQATLNSYADLVQWYSLGQNSLNAATGKQDFQSLMQRYEANNILYTATMANIPALLSPDNNNSGTMGFFNVLPDADGVLRRSLLVVPFTRSGNWADAELYGSLEVQTIRLYLGLPSEQLTVNYNQTGIVSLQFGDKLQVKPDSIGRLAINYRGPERTYPYYSLVDVVQHKVLGGTFKDKIVLVGASATGIGDLRTPPYGGITYPGVEVHANAIDNLLNQNALTRGASAGIVGHRPDPFLRAFHRYLDGARGASMDVVRLELSYSSYPHRLRRIFARLVVELQRPRDDVGVQRFAGFVVSRPRGRKRKAPGAHRLRTISQPRSHSSPAVESQTGRAEKNRNHRNVQRHSGLHHHFRKS